MGRGAALTIEHQFATAVRQFGDRRLTEAEALCRGILRRAPQFADALVLLAVILCLADRHDKRLQAITLLQRALAIRPQDAQALDILGDAFTAEDDLEAAIDAYRRAIRVDPGRAKLYSKLGIALNDSGRNDEAIAAYGDAIARDPTAAQTWFNLGVALTDAKRHPDAIEAYREVIARRPNEAGAYLNIGLLLRAEGDYPQAIAAFRGALRTDGQNVTARFQLAASLNDAGIHDEALVVIDQVIAAASDWPEAQFVRGNILLALDRPAEAEMAFLAELARDPDSAQAHNNLGAALHDLGRIAEAAVKHRDALALDPGHIQAHTNLGVALQVQGDLAGARAAYEQAIALRSRNAVSHAKALSNLGIVLEQEGDHAAALDMHRRGVAVAPAAANVHFNLAVSLLRTGDLAAGWDEYEWRWRGGVPTLKMPDFPQPLWDGSDLDGRTLLVHVEQGLGDTLQFVRYLAPLTRQGRVVIVVPEPLKALLSSIAGLTVLGAAEAVPLFDVHIPVMSLARVAGTRVDTISAEVPYLAVDPATAIAWRRRIGDGPALKVGVVWSGNPKHQYDHQRSIAAGQLLPQLAMPGVELFSLQKYARAADEAALAGLPDVVTDLAPALGDFRDTAAAVSALDLVISVDTSVAHLAGALARPVWTLLPFTPDWRWLLERDDSPWYPTMRLFRQPRPGDWDAVLTRVRAELGIMALSHVAALPARTHLDIDSGNRAAIDLVESSRAGRGRN